MIELLKAEDIWLVKVNDEEATDVMTVHDDAMKEMKVRSGIDCGFGCLRYAVALQLYSRAGDTSEGIVAQS